MRNKWRCGKLIWDGSGRWPEWRKLAKREATRLQRRDGRKMCAERE